MDDYINIELTSAGLMALIQRTKRYEDFKKIMPSMPKQWFAMVKSGLYQVVCAGGKAQLQEVRDTLAPVKRQDEKK